MRFLSRGLFYCFMTASLWLSTREKLLAIESPNQFPQPTRNQDEPTKAESLERVYPVEDLLDQLSFLGLAERQAVEMLVACVECEKNRTVHVTDTTLSVTAQNEEQERIGKNIERFRKFGFGQYQLQIDFIELPVSDIVQLGLEWSVANQTAAVMSADFGWLDQRLQPFLESPGNLKKNSSIKTAILDEERLKAFSHYLQRKPKVLRIGAPTQTAFNGEKVTILHHVEKQFVVGPKDPTMRQGGEPIRINIPEGCFTCIQSIEDSDRVSVQLHGEVHWSRVVRVTDLNFQQNPLRVPTVELQSVQFNEHVPFGSTLVLLGPAADLNGVSHHSILMIHPETSPFPRPRELPSIRRLAMASLALIADKRLARLKIEDEPLRIRGGVVAWKDKITMEPPSDDEVVHALESRGFLNHLADGDREPIPLSVVKEFLHEEVDPGRFVPLIGMAKEHHRLYSCTVAKSDGSCPTTVSIDHCFFEME